MTAMKLNLPKKDFRSDFHIHTYRCGHASQSMSVFNIIKESEKKGLESIAILDHVSCKKDERRIFEIKEEVQSIKTDLKVYVSAECDAKDSIGFSPKIACSKELRKITDFIFCSIHSIPSVGKNWYPIIPISNKEEIKESWKIWIKNLFQKVDFDILAHPFMVLGIYKVVNNLENDLELIDLLINLAKKNKKKLEFNDSIPLKSKNEVFNNTYEIFIDKCLKNDIRYILGSDSHSLERIGQYSWLH